MILKQLCFGEKTEHQRNVQDGMRYKAEYHPHTNDNSQAVAYNYQLG